VIAEADRPDLTLGGRATDGLVYRCGDADVLRRGWGGETGQRDREAYRKRGSKHLEAFAERG
jgi:hypothetical protein